MRVNKIDGSKLTREEQRKIVRSSLTELELAMFRDLQQMMGAKMVYFENDTHRIGKPDKEQ